MKQVLVLGSGLVARPLIRYLLDKGYQVVVGTLLVRRAQEILADHPNGKVCLLDVQDGARLASFVEACDLAVSLLPFHHHPQVARLCISLRRHLVTTSYISADMQELDAGALAAGVTVLNEIGLDPGIDHMSAMRVIDDVHRRGGRVLAFRSYCGGLPAPEANDNPFGYKFSWAPRGVLLAGRSGASYLLDGCRIDVPPHRLFRDMHIFAFDGLGDFEAYPNRDSIRYLPLYGLGGAQTMVRATLRNVGWCDSLFQFGRLGLFSLDEVDVSGKTYADFMRDLAGAGLTDDLGGIVAAKLGIPRDSCPVRNLEWLGMFSARKFRGGRTTPLDALGELMFEKLAFRPGERDMVALHHEFRVEFPDGTQERITCRLVDFGIPHGDSAMARTVSLPAAIGADLILSGRIQSRGVLRPIAPDIYVPVLDELEALNLVCREKREPIRTGIPVQ